jgi:hypothetical protein
MNLTEQSDVIDQHKKWSIGQIWKTEHGFLMRVENIRPDGVALIAMIEPYKTRSYSQKEIPIGWTRISE